MLSIGGRYVDNNFERRACMAGFKSVIIDVLEDQDLLGSSRAFANESAGTTETQLLHSFILNNSGGQPIRDEIRMAIADAVDRVG